MFCFSLHWYIVHKLNDFIDQTVVMEGASPPSYSPWMRDFMFFTKLGKVIRPGSGNKKWCTFLLRKFLSNLPPPFLSVFLISFHHYATLLGLDPFYYQWIYFIFVALFCKYYYYYYIFFLSGQRCVFVFVWLFICCVGMCVHSCLCGFRDKKKRIPVYPCWFQLNKNKCSVL